MQLAAIREARATKMAEARRILATAETEKRSLNPAEQSAFDKFNAEITSLEADEQRAQFVEDCERRTAGDPVGGRSFDAVQRQVNVVEVIRAQMKGRSLSGAAAEFAQKTEHRSGRKAQGVFVPLSAIESRAVNTTSTAPELVPTVHRADQYIQPFRNSLLARHLGVHVLSGLSGLSGNLSIPKHGTGTTVGWVAENAALPGC